jgi:molecular chaperone DnaK
MDVIGIDLGTTKSAVAVWQTNEPVIIQDTDGDNIVPSVVALNHADGQWVVGKPAKEIASVQPESAIYSIKRFIGRRFSDEKVLNSLESHRILYEVEESPTRRDRIEVEIEGSRLTPQEVSAKILRYLKERAEAYLGDEVQEAVITVPAYFHDSQRQATRDAGRIAGLNVKRVLSEPTAACLAFGYQKLSEERKTVAVYDLGGGTFDISIMEVGQGPFRVLATNGDPFLGGDDLDWLIVDWALEQIGGEEAKKLQHDVHALAHLRAAAEQVKKELSKSESARLRVKGKLSEASPLSDLDLPLTQTQLDLLAKDFVARTLVPCERAVHDSKIDLSSIKEVLLVGGQTRMPAIRKAVREYFQREPNTSVKPEEVVALGAAVQAAILMGKAKGLKLADVVPQTLGVSTKGDMDAIIARNTPIPVTKSKIYSTAYDNQENVEIKIYQGESALADNNIMLGRFILKGIAPAPAREPEIEVKFHVDQDGILHVTGKDQRTNNVEELTITDSMRLSEEEVKDMIGNAQKSVADEDSENNEQAD